MFFFFKDVTFYCSTYRYFTDRQGWLADVENLEKPGNLAGLEKVWENEYVQVLSTLIDLNILNIR